MDLVGETLERVDRILSWNSTEEIGRIGRHRAETHRYFNIRFFGQMPPDASDFPGGIPAIEVVRLAPLGLCLNKTGFLRSWSAGKEPSLLLMKY